MKDSDSSKTFIWHRPSIWRRMYELRWRDATVGRFRHSGAFTTRGLFEMDGRKWESSRKGVFRARFDIVDSETGESVATYRQQSLFGYGGVASLSSGVSFRISATGLRVTRYDIFLEAGGRIGDFRVGMGLSRTVAEIRIDDPDVSAEELAVLCLIVLRIKIEVVRSAAAAGS